MEKVKEAIAIIEEADRKSLEIRKGIRRPVVRRVADRGNTAYRIVVENVSR